jgi:hypothetical protein
MTGCQAALAVVILVIFAVSETIDNMGCMIGSNRCLTSSPHCLPFSQSRQLALPSLRCSPDLLCGAAGLPLLVANAPSVEDMQVRIHVHNPSYHLFCSPQNTASSGGSFDFQLSDAAGTKLVSRNVPGPVSTLAVVAKAGTRYQWIPGLSEGLANFAFRVRSSRIDLMHSPGT